MKFKSEDVVTILSPEHILGDIAVVIKHRGNHVLVEMGSVPGYYSRYIYHQAAFEKIGVL